MNKIDANTGAKRNLTSARALKLALLASIAGCALGQGSLPASATDIAVPRMYAKAPPMVASPVYDWSGFYAGIHGGYAADPATGTFDPRGFTTASTSAGPLIFFDQTTPAFGFSESPKGGFGGFQIGYNWQPLGSPWLFGVEADASFGRIKGKSSNPFAVSTGIDGDTAENSIEFTGLVHLRQQVDDFGTVRARLGYAANTLLLYGTGGMAWARTKTSLSLDGIAIQRVAGLDEFVAALNRGGALASSNNTRYGYAVGAGAEWAFASHWSVKAEYVYLNFTTGGTTLVIPGGVAHAGNFDMHSAKGGINYHF